MEKDNLYWRLRPSTRAYLFALVGGLIGPLSIPNTDTMLFAIVNVIFSIIGLLAVFAFILGLIRSWKEARLDKSSAIKKLEEKGWYRALRVTGYVALILGGCFIFASDAGGQTFPLVIAYIFAARGLRYLFFYITLHQKDISIIL